VGAGATLGWQESRENNLNRGISGMLESRARMWVETGFELR
jgi:hypothetical protein